MVFFPFKKLGIGADSLGSVCQGVNDTIFSSQVLVTAHCKYISVCVGFLCTVVMRDLSGCGITNVSKKGKDPSSLDVSEVNWMCGCRLLRCSRNSCDFLCPQRCHHHIFSTFLEDAQLC